MSIDRRATATPSPIGTTVALGATVVLLVAAAAGLPLSGSTALVAACGAILVFGLPHGALDIELIRGWGTQRRSFLPVLAVYLGIAAATATAWLVAPVAALAGFIVVAVMHFAEDWAAAGSRFLATGLGVALIAAPALRHRDAVAGIFVALAGAPAAGIADALLLVAPVALAIAAAGIIAMTVAHRSADAVAAIASLLALLIVPPVAGFAAFFCLFHSPRHFVGALAEARRWRVGRWAPVVVPVTGAALAIVTAIYVVHDRLALPERLTAATFMALAILTVPHMLAPAAVRRLSRPPRQTPKKSFVVPHLPRASTSP